MDVSQDSHRLMVEDIVVTPFFRKHARHKSATIKLHAEIREEKEHVILETDIRGYAGEDVEVEATPNSIDVSLRMEKNDDADIKFHSSYHTPAPIDASDLKIRHTDGKLIVTAKKL